MGLSNIVLGHYLVEVELIENPVVLRIILKILLLTFDHILSALAVAGEVVLLGSISRNHVSLIRLNGPVVRDSHSVEGHHRIEVLTTPHRLDG